MQPIPNPKQSCACQPAPCCDNNTSQSSLSKPKQDIHKTKFIIFGLLYFGIWLAGYLSIIPVSSWITYELFKLTPDSALANTVEFFIYDTSKIIMLLVFMVYVIAWIRASLSVDRVRNYLKGKRRLLGYSLGSGFGAITPFCSCSSIPLFLGFTTARIPIGITMSFLITSPLINEVAIVLLWGLLGWKFTLIYITVGMLVGIVGGVFMDVMQAERWLQPYLRDKLVVNHFEITARQTKAITWQERHLFAYDETDKIFKKIWAWVIIGVGLGAILHGYLPQEWITEHLGAGQWWSVPTAVLVGIPLYTNVTGIIPIMESLILKGLPVGTTLALCMSAVAISLPEILMLKQVMQWRLLSLFIIMMLIIFTIVGWFFNLIGSVIF